MTQSKTQLATYLKGIVQGLEEYDWTVEHACRTMRLHLVSNGFLKKVEEHYVEEVK